MPHPEQTSTEQRHRMQDEDTLRTEETVKRTTRRTRLLGSVRDLSVFAVLAWAVIAYQSKDMLATNGEVHVSPFQLPTLAGTTKHIRPQVRPTLVYFFAPWCGICRNTITHLHDVDLTQTAVVVIALDYSSIEAVEAFVADTGLTLPVHLGTTALRDQFQVQGYPSYYVLDQDFAVVDKAMGYLTVLELKLRGTQ